MTLKEAIRVLAMSGAELYCKICTVDAVDVEARTVDCTPIDESAPLVGVNLQASQDSSVGVVLFPAVGSYVIVAFITPAVAAVVLCDKIDKAQLSIGKAQITVDAEVVDTSLGDTSFRITSEGVQFNGGKLGGLLKIEQLTEKFNELIRAFNTHTHTIPVGGVPVTGTATAQSNLAPVEVPAVTQTMPEVKASDYEDAKVKH
ncbi:MAG: hypothetical protein ACLR8T_12935 [Alistipes finegoldii]|jgi:hypothetical protein